MGGNIALFNLSRTPDTARTSRGGGEGRGREAAVAVGKSRRLEKDCSEQVEDGEEEHLD